MMFRSLTTAFATCLVLTASVVVQADSTTPQTLVYGQDGSSTPKYRTWSGSAWSIEVSTVGIGAYPRWAIVKNCPVRNELLAAYSDSANDLNVMRYNGSSWGSLLEANTTLNTTTERPFYLAYEQLSGDALLAYRCTDGGCDWRAWNGSSWTAESTTSIGPSGNPTFAKLVSKPSANEIMLVALDVNSDIKVTPWNGASWGSTTTVETNAAFTTTECVDAAYEQSSGRCLLVWAENGVDTPRYRLWTGSAWTAEADAPDIGGMACWIRLAPEPQSNRIIMMTLDSGNDVSACVWDGSSWGAVEEIENNADASDYRGMDAAFELNGTYALAAYTQNGQNNVRYRTFDGTNWSAEGHGPDLGHVPHIIQLMPTGTDQDIHVGAIVKDTGALQVMRWTGAELTDLHQLESNVSGVTGRECFMFSEPIRGNLTPAHTPYFTNFETGVGPEWSSATTTTNSTYTTFAGRHTTGNLQLAVNTTIGESYTLTFDLYTIDSWDGNGADWDPYYFGPDYFNVAVNGTQVFHHTFAHEMDDFGASYPYPYDGMGHYGFVSWFKDAYYRSVEVVITATTSVTTFGFSADFGTQHFGAEYDESWGIDNVGVAASRFVDVSSATGFNVVTTTSDSDASGLHWGDLDDDGDLDAILTGATSVSGNSASRLVLNTHAGQAFTSTTFGGGSVHRQGGLLDIDNDGDLDFWGLPATAGGNLYQNNGGGSLGSAGNLGLSSPSNNDGVGANDANRDGWIDVMMFSVNGNWIGQHGAATPVVLTETNSSGTGLNDSSDTGNGDFCSSGDVNNDGYLDFFYHYGSGKLFLSTGPYTFVRDMLGISVTTSSDHRIGSAWADFDNDADLDLFVTRYATGSRGYLWRQGTSTFSDVSQSAKVLDTYGQRGCCWGDYDNDGDLDLYICTHTGTNQLYRNEGNATFRPLDQGTRLSNNPNVSTHDAVFVDYDNDGDLDLAVTRQYGTAVLLQNRTNNTNYLKVRVLGAGGGRTNKAAAGVRVELWDAAGTTFLARREIGVARGFGGCEPMWLHFGGVDPTATYKVKTYLHSRDNDDPLVTTVVPGSVSTTIGSRTIPQMLTVQEPNGVKVINWREVHN